MRDSCGERGRCSVKPERSSQLVETTTLADDMVGLTLTETSESWVLWGVTIPEVCVGLKLSAVKDTEEVAVEVGPSMDRGGATIPKVGLFGSKYGKGRGDGLCLFGDGDDKGV